MYAQMIDEDTDEDSCLQIESIATVNLFGVSTSSFVKYTWGVYIQGV